MTPTPTNTPTGGTVTVPPGGDLQGAITNAACGSTIVLQANGVYNFTGPLLLPAKPPCGQYTTIQTSALASLPNRRLNPSFCVSGTLLAHLVASGTDSVMATQVGANHYKFIGLDFTNATGTFQPILIQLGRNTTYAQRLTMTDFVFDRVFVHPPEININNLSSTSMTRSAERGLQANVVNWTVTKSYFGGFAGFYPGTTQQETSEDILMDSGPGPAVISDNYLDAFYSSVFLGGASAPPDPAKQAQVSNASTIGQATLSTVNGLNIGDYIAFQATGAPEGWEVGQVTSVGSTIPQTPQGFGSSTAGGNAQAAVHVTNLNDGGAGSFRVAVGAGNRNIIFDTSGTITLLSDVVITSPNITIDGSTAGGNGITFANAALRFDSGAHDIILKNTRHRTCGVSSVEGDCVTIKNGVFNMLVDHISTDSPTDGNIDITNSSHDITVEWSILSNGGKAMLLNYGTYNISLHDNLWYTEQNRSPNIQYQDAWTGALSPNIVADFVNNLVYIWGNSGRGSVAQCGGTGNIINNTYFSGATDPTRKTLGIVNDGCPSGTTQPSFFTSGNVSLDSTLASGNAASRFAASPVVTTSACLSAQAVKADAGDFPRDATDTTSINNISLPACAAGQISYTPVTALVEQFPQAPDMPGLAQWNGFLLHDVTIQNNTIFKPVNLGWGNPKNYMEIKAGDHVTIEGNTMLGGTATNIAFTVRNQGGLSPWIAIKNLVFQNNKVDNYVDPAFGILAKDNENVSIVSGPLTIRNNLFTNGIAGSRYAFTENGSESFTHNTALPENALVTTDIPVVGFIFNDNIVNNGVYGFACGFGDGARTTCYPSFNTLSKNIINDNQGLGVGNVAAGYPAGNFVTANQAAIGFTNAAAGDYSLAPSSTYKGIGTGGNDPGANMCAITAGTAALPSGSCENIRGIGGTSAGDSAIPLSSAFSASDNTTVVAGWFSGTVNFGGGVTRSSNAGSHDIFVAKYDFGQNLVWVNTFGSTSNGEQANAVAVDPLGNVYLAGFFTGTVNFGGGGVVAPLSPSGFLAEYTPSGAFIYEKTLGSSGDAVASDAAGNIAFGGGYFGTVNFGCGNVTATGTQDTIMVKYNTAGTCLWSQSHGGASAIDNTTAMTFLSGGDIAADGWFSSGSVNTGCSTFTNGGGRDGWIARYSGATGACVWSRQIGGPGDDSIYAIARDSLDNVGVGGLIGSGTHNFGGGSVSPPTSTGGAYVAKYDLNNNFLWVNQYGQSSNLPVIKGVTFDNLNNMVFTGATSDSTNFCVPFSPASSSYDPVIGKINPSGACKWAVRGGTGLGQDNGYSVVTNALAEVIGTGDFAANVGFGCDQLSSPGGQDGYLVKLYP